MVPSERPCSCEKAYFRSISLCNAFQSILEVFSRNGGSHGLGAGTDTASRPWDGHEGAGIVVDVGPGVTSVKKGDHVIPLYTPECRQCPSCLSRKTNLCTAIRATQGQGVMPDGTSRFSFEGKKLHHYMGTSTFSNYTVLPEIAVAKIREDAPFDKVCYIGWGVTTGIGAVLNTAKVEPGSKCVVFGLGGIGLNVIQGLRLAGADMIIGVDVNNSKKEW